MAWTPSVPIRWGDRATLEVPRTGVPTPIAFVSGELCRLEADVPCVWLVRARVVGIDPADVRDVSVHALLRQGIGSFSTEESVSILVGFPGGTMDLSAQLPAQHVSVRIEIAGNTTEGGLYVCEAWAAPMTDIGARNV